MQTGHAASVEIPRQLAVNQAIRQGNISGPTFTYCIGHGEFLRSDWLLRARFPEKPPIDDLPTGIMLGLAGQQIVPLPLMDLCTVPARPADLVRQTANWFDAQLDFEGPHVRAQKVFGSVPVARSLRARFELYFCNATWAAYGPICFIAVLASILSGTWYVFATILGAIMIEAILVWSVGASFSKLHGLIPPNFTVAAFTRELLRSAGPCLGLIRRITRFDAPFFKTERS